MEIVKRVQGGDARRGEKSFQSKDEDERNERDADAREETDVTAIASIASIASIDREPVETAEDSFRRRAEANARRRLRANARAVGVRARSTRARTRRRVIVRAHMVHEQTTTRQSRRVDARAPVNEYRAVASPRLVPASVSLFLSSRRRHTLTRESSRASRVRLHRHRATALDAFPSSSSPRRGRRRRHVPAKERRAPSALL